MKSNLKHSKDASYNIKRAKIIILFVVIVVVLVIGRYNSSKNFLIRHKRKSK